MKHPNWIKRAIGGNHGKLHRALGIPQGKTIPSATLAAAARKGGTIGREARLAQTLKSFH